MKAKRIAALLIAGIVSICVLSRFGSENTSMISCSFAENSSSETVYTDEANIYFISDKYSDALTLPEDMPTSYHITLDGDYSSVKYTASSSDIKVDEYGVVSPVEQSVLVIGVGTRNYFAAGDYIITAYADNDIFVYSIHVIDYAEYYTESVLREYIDKNITENMTELEKLDKITAFPAQYPYSVKYYTTVDLVVFGEGGDCWASSYAIKDLCNMVGIKSRLRVANMDYGAGSGHRNVVAQLSDGSLYMCEAGYSQTSTPRPYNVTKLDDTFMYDYLKDGTLSIKDYYGFDNDITVPESIDGMKVTEIGENVFYNADLFIEGGVTSVKLPDSITSIGKYAFEHCQNLTKLYLPASVKDIGICAFYCNPQLSLVIDENNPYLSYSDGMILSKDRKTLIAGVDIRQQELVIPEGVETIKSHAFYSNENIKNVTFPESLTAIEDRAFTYCDLRGSELILPESVSSVGSYCFYNLYTPAVIIVENPECKFLNDDGTEGYPQILYGSNTIIAGYSGSATEKLAENNGYLFADLSQTQPVTVTSGSCTDNGTWILSWSRDIGASLTINVDGEFNGINDYTYPYAEKVIFSDGVKSIQQVNTLPKNVTELLLPDGLETIGSSAFINFTKLTELDIPESVKSIESRAFSGCTGLSSVTLHEGLETIGSYAFYNCPELKEIYIPKSVNTIESLAVGYYPVSIYKKMVEGFSITVHEDSAGHSYVKNTSMSYILIPNYKVSDLVTVTKYLHGKNVLTYEQFQREDINKDDIVDIFDMVGLRKKIIENS